MAKNKKLRGMIYLAFAFLVFAALSISQSNLPLAEAKRGKGSTTQKQLETRKKECAAQLEKIRGMLKEVREQKADMQEVVQKVDADLDDAVETLNETKREEQVLIVQHERLKDDLDAATEDFKEHLSRYRVRVIAFYMNGDVSNLEILLRSKNFSDFISRMHYLRLLADRDKQVLQELRDKRKAIETKKQAVARKKQEVAINVEMQTLDKVQIQSILEEKRSALGEIEKNEDLLIQQEQQLELEINQIQKDIQRMIEEAIKLSKSKTLAPTFSGSFNNPMCDGSWHVTSGYGPRKRPKSGASAFHKGIDLRAGYGQNICAVASGTVIFAGYKGGYGNTVMIAHSRDLVTLYGHGKGFPGGIRKGATVKQGDVILFADSTGTSTGNHLHFSVFKNSVASNPMNYFNR
jgi:murein DD-endopeptidase MepM/ murein hydrolase activator NlpD